MKELRETIEIEAPASDVWDALCDLDHYPEWNPLLPAVRGELRREAAIQVDDPARGVVQSAIVTEVNRNRMLSWRAGSSIAGLFEREHILELSPAGPGLTRLANRVQFRGILVPLLGPHHDEELARRLGEMNRALRHRVEHAAGTAAAATRVQGRSASSPSERRTSGMSPRPAERQRALPG